MRTPFLWLILGGCLLVLFCSSKEEAPAIDYGLVATGEAFNPQGWHKITRGEMARILPHITNIQLEVSGGPFELKNEMGLSSILFTFEAAERDDRLMSLYAIFSEPVTVSQAAKKFGVNLGGTAPQKLKRCWNYILNKPLILNFCVDLKPTDTDSARTNRAWIVYYLPAK